MIKTELIVDYQYKGLNPVQFGREDCAPGHFFGPSVRTHWLLHYIASGAGKFVYKQVTWAVGPGDLFVIPPYEETYYEADRKHPWSYIWIGFTADQDVSSILNRPVIHCPGAGWIFTDMIRCGKMENGRSAFLCAKIWELFSVLLEQDKPDADPIRKALSYMNSEYINGITVQQVAQKLHLNRTYFSETFKAQMGLSPQQYLIQLRLERAAELLTVYGETPSTAALSVGYSDLYHFSKMFKQHFGSSPRIFQKQYREKNRSDL